MRRFIVIMLLCMISPLLAEQNIQALKVLSLDDAIALARENNGEVKKQESRVSLAEAQMRGSYSPLVPGIESEASVTRQSYESGVQSMSDGQYDLRFAQLRLAFNPDAVYHSVESGKEKLAVAKNDLLLARRKAAYDTAELYYGICRAHELVKVRESSYGTLQVNLTDTENMFRSGTVSRYDLLQAQTRLKNVEPQIEEARNLYQTSVDRFNFTLGCDKNIYTAETDGTMRSFHSGISADDTVLERLISAALSRREEIQDAEKMKQIYAHSAAAAAAGKYFPIISLNSSYGMTKSMTDGANFPPMLSSLDKLAGSGDWEKNWTVRGALTYRWNSFLPGDSSNELSAEFSARLAEAEQISKDIRQSIAISVAQEYRRLCSASVNIASCQTALASAEEGLRIAQESYRAGVIKNSDLLSAELARTEARSGEVQALTDYYTAMKRLEFECGGDISEIVLGGNK